MASITTNRKTGNKRLQFLCPKDGSRKTIHLGNITKKVADTFRAHIEELIAARASGTSISAETATWVGKLSDSNRKKLEGHGLVGPDCRVGQHTLQELVDEFVATRSVKSSTLTADAQATDSLIEHCKGSTSLAKITTQVADGWRKSLDSSKLAKATVAKRVNVVKQLFAKAVRWKWLTESPFARMKPGSQRNMDKLVHVPQAVIQRVLACCKHDQDRLIVGLARYAGLRCPSELVPLRWKDVRDQDAVPHLLVSSPKTAHHENGQQREVPIDADLMALIRAVPRGVDDAPVVPRVKSAAINMRKMLQAAVKAAGEQMWPRCFQNLRASCEMDWINISGVSPYTVASWMGHSVLIAEKHYVKARREQMLAVTSGKKSDAKYDALVTQNTTQHRATPTIKESQRSLQSFVFPVVMPLGAFPCGLMQFPIVGEEGFEPSKAKPTDLQSVLVDHLSIRPRDASREV